MKWSKMCIFIAVSTYFPDLRLIWRKPNFAAIAKKSPDSCKMQANDKGGASLGASMSRIQKILNTPLYPKYTILN